MTSITDRAAAAAAAAATTRDDRAMAAAAKEHKKQVLAIGFVVLVLALMMFLTFVTIPSGNKDIIVSIISMIVGGLGLALARLFGERDEEVDELRKELEDLRVRYEVLKSSYDDIVGQLVRRIDIGALGAEL